MLVSNPKFKFCFVRKDHDSLQMVYFQTLKFGTLVPEILALENLEMFD